jgi:hypothetical protein
VLHFSKIWVWKNFRQGGKRFRDSVDKNMRFTFEQYAEGEDAIDTIVIKKKGIGWEARFPGVETTLGTGQTPEEALTNLLRHPEGTGFEDWGRENRKAGGLDPVPVRPKPEEPKSF